MKDSPFGRKMRWRFRECARDRQIFVERGDYTESKESMPEVWRMAADYGLCQRFAAGTTAKRGVMYRAFTEESMARGEAAAARMFTVRTLPTALASLAAILERSKLVIWERFSRNPADRAAERIEGLNSS